MGGWVGDWVSWLLQKGVHHHKVVEVAKDLHSWRERALGLEGRTEEAGLWSHMSGELQRGPEDWCFLVLSDV